MSTGGKSKSTAIGFGLVAWLAALAACLVPALLLRDRMPNWLVYILLVALQVLPAVLGAFVFVLRLGADEKRPARQGGAFAVICALTSTTTIAALLFVVDLDRPTDTGGIALFLVFVIVWSLVNASLALLGGVFAGNLASRVVAPRKSARVGAPLDPR
ncbi:MAG: hypothetical protein ACYCX3_09665 [Thermoleophilia bacterium]